MNHRLVMYTLGFILAAGAALLPSGSLAQPATARDPDRWTTELSTPQARYQNAKKEATAAYQQALSECKAQRRNAADACRKEARRNFDSDMADAKKLNQDH